MASMRPGLSRRSIRPCMRGYPSRVCRGGGLYDVIGIAGVVNGIFMAHRAYLKAGGDGFILGDGTLNYGHESIIETYYNAKLYEHVFFSFDYQLVTNPGYNRTGMGR